MGPGERRVPGLVMLCTKGFTKASQHVLPKARAASSSGRKRSAKPCSCRSARFSLQQRAGSTRCCRAHNGLGAPPGKQSAAVAPCPAPCQPLGAPQPHSPPAAGAPRCHGPCPHWALGPSPAPEKLGGCAAPAAARSHLCLTNLCRVRTYSPLQGTSLVGYLCAHVPSLNLGDPKVALALRDRWWPGRSEGPSLSRQDTRLLLSWPCSPPITLHPGPGTPGTRWRSQETTHLPKSCSSCPRSRQISWHQA